MDPYHGWVMAYDPQTLEQKAVLNVTPDGSEGGIWASDTGLGADADGSVYVATGNGTFDAASGGRDYGDSLLKLALENSSLVVTDSFTPSKGGMIYVIDRDRMGQFHSQGDAVVERIHMAGGGYGAMAYWNGHVFFASSDDYLRDYAIENGQLTLKTRSSIKFENPGATPSVSADGNKNAIVWAIATKTWNGVERPVVLYAFDGDNIEQPIYTSERNSKRDRAAMATRFVIPLVVNGRVYFGARGEVEVYGLLK